MGYFWKEIWHQEPERLKVAQPGHTGPRNEQVVAMINVDLLT